MRINISIELDEQWTRRRRHRRKPLRDLTLWRTTEKGTTMTTVTSFDMLEGEDMHVTAKNQAGRVLPATVITWAFDAGLQGNLTVTPDPAGGFVVHAATECTGTLSLTAKHGNQNVTKNYPVVVSQSLTDVVLETP